MKLPREVLFIIVVGLFLLGYVLDAVVEPLMLDLAHPYEFFLNAYYTAVPFSSVSITVKALAIFLIPFLLYSFVDGAFITKAAITLVIAGLLQLYSLQDIVTGSNLVPQEYALAFTLAGVALILPSLIFFIIGLVAPKNIPLPKRETPNFIKQSLDEEKNE